MSLLPPLVVVVVACHNRCEVTLRGLATLLTQRGRDVDWRLRVILVDDASTDGTADAVVQRYPDVTVLRGSGSLFWGGGMHKAMIEALKCNPDYTVLFNDDVELQVNAISDALGEYKEAVTLTRDPRQVIVGAMTDPATGHITYSGFNRVNRNDPSKIVRVSPSSDRLVECDTMNGNFVLVPRAITDRLGTVDPTFIHQLGDIDYGYRVVRAGGRLWVARKPMGSCAPNNRTLPFRKPGQGLRDRWRALNHPLGLPLRSWLPFMWRWGGVYGVARLFGIYTKQLFRP